MNILFVDDEPAIIEALENRLYKMRGKWSMRFAIGAQQALVMLQEQSFDVIVSDIRMSGMNGVELLERVRERYPEMMRLALTGQTEREQLLKLFGLTHSIVGKPARQGDIESAINRAASIKQILTNKAVYKVVANINSFPAVPTLHQRLASLIRKENVSFDEIAALIEQDASMAARLLQIANSSIFNSAREIVGLSEAITYIGLEELSCIVLSTELFDSYGSGLSFPGFSLKGLQQHSIEVARIAQRIMGIKKGAKIAFTSAVLHDVGLLVMAAELPEVFKASCAYAKKHKVSLHAAAIHLNACCHCEVGAYLLAMWGFPLSVIEAVAHRHQPKQLGKEELTPASAVHLADCLCNTDGWLLGVKEQVIDVDGDHLSGHGFKEGMEGWRQLSREVEMLKGVQ